jgi:hypothetical protein
VDMAQRRGSGRGSEGKSPRYSLPAILGAKFHCDIPERFGNAVKLYALGGRIYCICEHGTFEVPVEAEGKHADAGPKR